ncbi:MAG: M15 family metallopeptidase [Chloroflexota bacterium]|nr:M15 family metallopeptidase [Chloroflexota bacterium]
MSKLIALGLALALVIVVAPPASGAAAGYSGLAAQLLADPSAVVRDATGRPISVFDLPATEARIILLPVGRDRPLPAGYEPPDLTWAAGRPVRQVAVDDLRAMIDAAAADGVDLAPISGYRSPDEQAAAYESSIRRAIDRSGGTIDRAEAEARAARFVAPLGHSQHQLGTAVDFSTWEIGYAIQPRFEDTTASRWLAARGWEYGFVLPYPRDKEARTGYTYEPWHWRWIGRTLAAALWRDGYVGHPEHVVDDYLRAVEEILDAEAVP